MCNFRTNNNRPSKFRVRAYQTPSFIFTSAQQVTLLVDNIGYELGDFTSAIALKNALNNMLLVLGHYSQSELLNATAAVAYDGVEWVVRFVCTQGFHTRIGLKLGKITIPPTTADFGALCDFVQGNDGRTLNDLSDWWLITNQTVVQGANSGYQFLERLSTTEFDNSSATTNSYLLQGLQSGQSWSVSTNNHLALGDVVGNIQTIIPAINQQNGWLDPANGYVSHYVNNPSTANALFPTKVRITCSEDLEVFNGGAPLPSTNGTIKTGYKGNLQFLSIDFVQLNLVGSEPAILFQYQLAGSPRTDVFAYNPFLYSYI